MAVATASVTELCRAAQAASRVLATLPTTTKDAALLAIADALEARTPEVLEANARDVEAGREQGLSPALTDRLRLDAGRVRAMADGVRAIAALRDPVGEVLEGFRLPNGLDVDKVRVPLGVVAVVYEARPNVTIDATALALKSGNAIVLRGSSHRGALQRGPGRDRRRGRRGGRPARRGGDPRRRRRPRGARRARHAGGRRRPRHPARGRGPEGRAVGGRHGAGHLRRLGQLPCRRRRERRPRRRAPDRPERQDPAAGRLQRGRDAARPRRRGRGVPARRAARAARGRGRAARRRPRPRGRRRGAGARPARRRRRGLGHGVPGPRAGGGRRGLGRRGDRARQRARLGPLRGDRHPRRRPSARAFERRVDAAVVYVNASTRFTDGGEFGMGAEIGNSTQKLHARGPIGMRELCTTSTSSRGDGQVRG